MLLSQSGPGAGAWLTALPTHSAVRIRPLRMQVASESKDNQTLQSPTDTTAGKTFLAINNDTSSDTVTVNGRSLAAGENLLFRLHKENF